MHQLTVKEIESMMDDSMKAANSHFMVFEAMKKDASKSVEHAKIGAPALMLKPKSRMMRWSSREEHCSQPLKVVVAAVVAAVSTEA